MKQFGYAMIIALACASAHSQQIESVSAITVDDFMRFCTEKDNSAAKVSACGSYIDGAIDQLAGLKNSAKCYATLADQKAGRPAVTIWFALADQAKGPNKSELLQRAVRKQFLDNYPECRLLHS